MITNFMNLIFFFKFDNKFSTQPENAIYFLMEIVQTNNAIQYYADSKCHIF